MCGISAFSRAEHSSLSDSRRAIIAGLLTIEHRGPDSTGVAWTQGKAEKVWYDTRVGPATKVAHTLDLSGKARIHSAIMHTRWATHGKVDRHNAHPLVCDRIVLIHNGVLSNHQDLVEFSGKVRPKGVDVDSWALAALIAAADELGEHPADLLRLVEGDAAIAWFDAEQPEAVHLARIHGRPMTIGFTRRGDLLMSSTRQTLRAMADVLRVSLDDVTDVPEGTYLKVVTGHIAEWRVFAEPPPKVRKPSVHHGITDLVEARPDDWWDRAGQAIEDDEFAQVFGPPSDDPWRSRKYRRRPSRRITNGALPR